jgi:hypothetical protein
VLQSAVCSVYFAFDKNLCTENGENRISPRKVLYMDLETTRLRGRPRNRWQDEVREDGRLVGGKG